MILMLLPFDCMYGGHDNFFHFPWRWQFGALLSQEERAENKEGTTHIWSFLGNCGLGIVDCCHFSSWLGQAASIWCPFSVWHLLRLLASQLCGLWPPPFIAQTLHGFKEQGVRDPDAKLAVRKLGIN